MSGDHCLQPLLQWLNRVDIITEDQITTYADDQMSLKLFEELRNGYMLAKLAVSAVPHLATTYREDMCINAMTR